MENCDNPILHWNYRLRYFDQPGVENRILMKSQLTLALVLTCNLSAALNAAEVMETAALLKAVNSIQEKDLKQSVAFLASDALEGRQAGDEGSRAAAVYLVERMEKYGLRPSGVNGTYQQGFGKNYQNLLGLIPGSDSTLVDELIVIGAHYDHVGYGYNGNSLGAVGKIHNGADDNGSGVAAMLEMMEAISLLDEPPRRPILFAFWDAEELGLLGSKHWTSRPTIPLNQVRFYINLDMIGRLTKNELEVYGVRTMPGLRRLYSVTNQEGISAKFDWYLRPDSDHYSFLKRGIPFLMPFTKKHPDYHRPSDDFDKVNYEGHAKITRHWFRILMRLGNEDELPEFRQKSLSENEGVRRRLESAPARRPSRLGISWNTEESEGLGELVVRNLVSTSPAWKAGIRPGDRVLAINGQPFETSLAFIRQVSASNPKSTMTVRKVGQEVPEEIEITLDGEPVLVGLAFRDDDAEPNSLVVSYLVPDSPASSAGLLSNDRIIALEGAPIESPQKAARELLNAAKPVKIEYERMGIVRETKLEPLKRLDPPALQNSSESVTSEE